ncbi:effector-associated constant component EACC1 [Actinoplanes regularis]|uniref:Uncharacterized protein n=1 Tax=Actinoplanes regularis TaxID=52697 RepID=A0A238Y326_9ACTN|nr:hypothetical protein [Actinoplanes regularis]GIE86223.1 hypothetical protein Are01nite_27030 [Actinoplanes regularis]SNR65625.1 hypothetical protein SAMN06264365_104228 [Actinoplanes regularis]
MSTLLIADDDPLALASLHRWLSRTPEVTRHGDLREIAGARTDTMDDTIAVIALVVSGVSALTDVLGACQAWHGNRTRPPATTVTIGDVTVDLSDPEVVRKLRELFPGEEHGPAA